LILLASQWFRDARACFLFSTASTLLNPVRGPYPLSVCSGLCVVNREKGKLCTTKYFTDEETSVALGSGSSLLEDRIGAQIRPKPPFACTEVIDEVPLTLEETDRQKINSPPGTMFFQEPQS